MVFNILELFKSEFVCSHYNKEHAILNAVLAMILAIKLQDNVAGITWRVLESSLAGYYSPVTCCNIRRVSLQWVSTKTIERLLVSYSLWLQQCIEQVQLMRWRWVHIVHTFPSTVALSMWPVIQWSHLVLRNITTFFTGSTTIFSIPEEKDMWPFITVIHTAIKNKG